MNIANVSVIIPTYNRVRLLREALDSVLAQTVRPRQIIVVDDGSSDGTEERMQQDYPQVTYIRQNNSGVSVARNAGIREAEGDLVAFLDSDDVWHPQKLAIQLEVLAVRPDIGMLGTRAVDWPDEPFTTIADDEPRRIINISWSHLSVKNRLTTSSVIVRRSALRAAGDFDPSLQGPEDRDLWLRVAERCPVADLDLGLTGYRTVPDSVSKQAVRCEAGMLRMLGKLDLKRSWNGRHRLRRKAYGYTWHACAYLHLADHSPGRAIISLLRSFAWYPLPFDRDEVRTPLERPKRLIVALLHLLRLRAWRDRAAGAPFSADELPADAGSSSGVAVVTGEAAFGVGK